MAKGRKYLCMLLMLLLCNMSSCYNFFDKNVDGIIVPEMLWYTADKYGIDYCKMLECAMDGSYWALNEFIWLEIFDADNAGQHSMVVLQVIRKKGERFIIKTLDWYRTHNKRKLLEYLDCALEYENGWQNESQNTKTEFPVLYEWLTSDETGIKVPDDLWYIADRYHIDYCSLLMNAFNDDSKGLDQFIFLRIFNANSIGQHSVVVLQLIRKKGERYIIEALDFYSSDNKRQLLEFLDTAIKYEEGDNDDVRNTKNEFPLIYEWLTSDETLGDS